MKDPIDPAKVLLDLSTFKSEIPPKSSEAADNIRAILVIGGILLILFLAGN